MHKAKRTDRATYETVRRETAKFIPAVVANTWVRELRDTDTGTIHSWDLRGAAGWNVSVALQNYQCHTIVAKSTREAQVSDTV